MFLTALTSILNIVEHSLAITRLMVESAKPEDRAAIVSRHNEHMARWEKLGDWLEDRLRRSDPPAPVVPKA